MFADISVLIFASNEAGITLHGGIYSEKRGDGATFLVRTSGGRACVYRRKAILVPQLVDSLGNQFRELMSAELQVFNEVRCIKLADALCKSVQNDSDDLSILQERIAGFLRAWAIADSLQVRLTGTKPKAVKTLAQMVEEVDWAKLYPGPSWAF
ncbi:MAG: hypothetical protein JJ714_05150 [Acidithiobacillus sp.]|nr:hypothetical protein [Acidithiobacillus sp.]